MIGITNVSFIKTEKGFSRRELLACSFPLDPEGERSEDLTLF
jgi:hypothetical protein